MRSEDVLAGKKMLTRPACRMMFPDINRVKITDQKSIPASPALAVAVVVVTNGAR